MIIKCMDNNLCSTLTIGKEYTVIEEGDMYYVILDDTNTELTTKKQRFHIIEDDELSKKTKATINELTYQINSNFKDIKDFKIRKNSQNEIKEIIIKFNYYDK